jgi:hypothetical protein
MTKKSAILFIILLLAGCSDVIEDAHHSCIVEAGQAYREKGYTADTRRAEYISLCMHVRGFDTHGHVRKACVANLQHERQWQFIPECYRPSGWLRAYIDDLLHDDPDGETTR